MGLTRRQSSQSSVYNDESYNEYNYPNEHIYPGSMSDMSGVSMYEDDPEISLGSFVNNTKTSNKLEMNMSVNAEKSSIRTFGTILQYIVFAMVALNTWQTNGTLSQTNSELAKVKFDFLKLDAIYIETEDEVAQAMRDFDKLKAASNAAKNAKTHQTQGRKELEKSITDKHESQYDEISMYQQYIQDYHYKELVKKYGKGPYKIRVSVVLEGQIQYFDIETAPIDLMPHSLYTFMDLVSQKAFDNTVFIHKVNHIMLGGPLLDLDKKEVDPGNVKNVKPLLFPEYSRDFPHVKYTVGFQGRPGGPQIYVNLHDNTKNHGPGGQKQHTLVEEADPCFAKVVSNLHILEELAKLNQKAIDGNEVYVTKIDSMRIIQIR